MKHQRGFSLIETAVAIAVLGIITVTVVGYWKVSRLQTVSQAEEDLSVRAENALTAFVFANYRLPCPASNNAGLEDCTGASVGFLPFITLGLPDAGAARLRYGVYQKQHADAWKDAALAAKAKDRLRPLVPIGDPPVVSEIQLLKYNLLDFCAALSVAGAAVADTAALHTVDAQNAVSNVAWAIAAPGLLDADGDGNSFDGNQALAGTAFSAPQMPGSATYDDRVRAMGFDTLFNHLQCAGALSVAGHSHFNDASSAALLSKGLQDYQKQLEIAALISGAGVASATASVVSSAGGVANSVAVSLSAIAKTMLSYGSLSGLIAAAAGSVAFEAASTVVATGALASAIAAKVIIDLRVEEIKPLITDAASLATSLDSNARAADAAGF